MINDEIIDRLFKLKDTNYRDFQSKLTPSLKREYIIGVRTPELRGLAKEYSKRADIYDFLNSLPHKYFDENQLHAFIISLNKDFDLAINEVERFLPYVDNWATCDQMSPKIFKKNKPELLKRIKGWLKSDKTYTIRFGIKMLMDNFLDDDFRTDYPEAVSKIRSEEYYVNMMTAWYFATALAKQYDSVIPYIERKKLPVWTHNKAIQKSVESLRISPERKEYLKSLKIKN